MEADLLLCAYGLLIGIIAGSLAGTLAGLAGLGGGLIYVPILLLAMPQYESNHLDNLALHVMISMVGVLITGVFSARSHGRLGHVNMVYVWQLLPGLIIGAALGLWLTLYLPAVVVLLALALLDIWIAFDYGHEIKQRKTAFPLVLYSTPIGYVSGSLGIGGGTMLVPLLRRLLPLRIAVGTSATCGMMMAAAAVLMNVVVEPAWLPLLSDHGMFLSGFCLGLMLILPHTSAWSARLHVQFSECVIRRILKALFIILALFLFIQAYVMI